MNDKQVTDLRDKLRKQWCIPSTQQAIDDGLTWGTEEFCTKAIEYQEDYSDNLRQYEELTGQSFIDDRGSPR